MANLVPDNPNSIRTRVNNPSQLTCAFLARVFSFHSVVLQNVNKFTTEGGNVLFDFVDVILSYTTLFALLLLGGDVATHQLAHYFHVTHISRLPGPFLQ